MPAARPDLPARLLGTDGADGDSGWRVLAPKVTKPGDANGAPSGQRFVFPMRAGGEQLGLVYIEYDPQQPAPRRECLGLLTNVARQATLLIEHMRLAETHRELEAARQLQLELFPRTLELVPGLDIAARNRPAFGVSGDYYDCQLAAPGKVVFIVADVMGHGVGAAGMMMWLHAAFRKAMQQGRGLQAMDRQLSEAMKAAGEEVRFATGLLGMVDLEAKSLLLISAGHPWPSILLDGRAVPPVDAACTFPWGLPTRLRRPPFPARIPLGERFSLLAYTDGVMEAKISSGGRYSASYIQQFHTRNLGCGARRLCDRLFDAVLTATDPSCLPHDDTTALAICSKLWRKAARSSQGPSLVCSAAAHPDWAVAVA
jgi:serine phosphatase RsbU (regulator of sigma subunit)